MAIREVKHRIKKLYMDISPLTMTILPMVIAGHFVSSFCLNIPAFFKKCHHIQYNSIGQFISTYYWGCLIGALIGGLLTLSFKTTKISGIGLTLLAGALYSFFNSLDKLTIILSMFFLGIIGAIIIISNLVSLIRSVKNSNNNEKLKVISLDLILFNLNYSIVTFILLDLKPKYISEFIICLIFGLIAVGLMSLVLCRDKCFSSKNQSKKFDYRCLIPLRKNEFSILISMIFCIGLIFSMVKVIFTPTLIDRFGSNMLSVTAASINPWLVFFIQPLIIHKIKDSNSTWFLGFGGLILGMGYFMLGMVNSFILTALILIFLTLGEMMFCPLSKHMNIQLFGAGQEGIASGIWRVVFLMGGAIGSWFSGYMAEIYGANMVWECCGLSGLICFICSLLLYRLKIKNTNTITPKGENYEYL